MEGRARPRYDDLEAPPRGERGGHGRDPDRYASGSSRVHYNAQQAARYDPRRDDRQGYEGSSRERRPYEREIGQDAHRGGYHDAGPISRQGPPERRRSISPPREDRRQAGGGRDPRDRRRSRSPHHARSNRGGAEPARADRDGGIAPPREQHDEREAPRSVPAPREGKEKDEDGEVVVEAQDEEAMMAAMGFASFGTTKGQKVNDPSQLGFAKVKQERTWRQYMNRKGGFNRILEKID